MFDKLRYVGMVGLDNDRRFVAGRSQQARGQGNARQFGCKDIVVGLGQIAIAFPIIRPFRMAIAAQTHRRPQAPSMLMTIVSIVTPISHTIRHVEQS